MQKETTKSILRGAAAILTGIGLATAFPPFGQSSNAWSCLVPLLWLVRVSSPKSAAKWAFASGVIFWLMTLSWFPAIIKNNGPWPLVLLGQLGLSAWCAGFWALFALLAAFAWQKFRGGWRLLAVCLVEPVLWAGCELVRGWLFSGFAWNFLGVSQAENAAMIQVASLAGVYGVSALLVLVNGAVTSICQRVAEPLWKKWSARGDDGSAMPGRTNALSRFCRMLESAVPLALVAVAWMWGALRVKAGDVNADSRSSGKWRVALIQPNTPCIFTFTRETVRLQRERLIEQTKMASAAHPDLTVWPETAVMGEVPYDSSTLDFLRAGAEASGASLLSGVMEEEQIAVSAKPLWYNAAWLFAKDGKPAGKYRKQHLVPFGEYIPGDKLLPVLQRLAPTGTSCTPGRDAGIMTVPKEGTDGLKIGSLICFEDTVPALSRNAVKAGAQALALMTNDAWFNGSCEPLQHEMQAVFRAVENGVPMLRCANSGVSCLVDAFGRVKRLESDGQLADFHGFLIGEIETPSLSAPYTCLGDIPLIAIFSVLVVLFAVLRYRSTTRVFHEER